MHINEILSQPLQVEPLKEGEVAEFRLLGADKINPKTKEPMRSAGVSLPGSSSIFDPHDGGKTKLIQNVVSYRSVKLPDGTLKEEPIIDRVRFGKNNTLRLTAQENETYGYLMRLDACENNAFRKKGARALYRLVNPREKAVKTIQDEELLLDARIIVRDATPTDLKAIATSLKVDTNQAIEVIQSELIKKAKAAPMTVIQASNDNVMKAKVRVREAIELNFIAYESEGMQWYWADSDKHPVIVVVPENQNPLKYLMSFVQEEEGRKFYKALLKKLNTFNKQLNGS